MEETLTGEILEENLFSSNENLEQFYIFEFALIVIILIWVMLISITKN